MLGVSDSVFEEFIFGRFFDKKEKIVGNPISVELIRRKTDGSNSGEEYDIAFLGRLSEPKNPLEYIEIVNDIQREMPVKAVMIGDGELREIVEEKIQELGLEEIINLKGFLENPYEVLQKCKVLCMPSRWEGFGLAAVEALALGVPVVATEVGGLPGIIDESCGKLCDSKETFVEEIGSLLSDSELYRKKISGANKRAEELDNIDQYISDMINVYKNCGVII